MKRRTFISSAALATAMAQSSFAAPQSQDQQFIELRKYQSLLGSKRGKLNQFLQNVAIPAYNRLGIETVGVFNVMFGETNPTVYVLLPHPSLESAAFSTRKLLEDKKFLAEGKEFLETELSDPAYVRYENSLFAAFKGMPGLQIPEAIQGKDNRIFEMRIYESHSELAAKKKIEMFNEGGEIDIFHKTNLNPVFFGESLFGPRMPNLTYMLAFENMQKRDEGWDTFRNSPEWDVLKRKEEYRGTVSNITDIILRPTNYSQI